MQSDCKFAACGCDSRLYDFYHFGQGKGNITKKQTISDFGCGINIFWTANFFPLIFVALDEAIFQIRGTCGTFWLLFNRLFYYRL